jgi:hypothetical protein
MPRPPRNWLTEEVYQTYTLGEDGMPIQLDTTLRIRALGPVSTIFYVFDTDELRVEGLQGCRAGKVMRDDYEPDKYWAVAVELDAPLEKGESTVLTYRTVFHYSSPPPNELVQSGGARGVERVKLAVQFHHAKLPSVARLVLLRDDVHVKSQALRIKKARVTSGVVALPPHHRLLVEW